MTDLNRRHLLAGTVAIGAATVTGLRPIATNAAVPQAGDEVSFTPLLPPRMPPKDVMEPPQENRQ